MTFRIFCFVFCVYSFFLKQSGNYVNHLLWHSDTRQFVHTVYLCLHVPYVSQNKRQLFP
jgi:hypothetical protein